MQLRDDNSSRWDVVVVGAGAAGLVAAERAAARGRRTLLLEKNRKPGVKILMSGGTRCNITQATDVRGIVDAYGKQGRFLHSALAQLGPDDLVALINGEGVATKVEGTGKIFPVSDRATDVLAAFVRRLRRSGCVLALEEPLLRLERRGDGFTLVTPTRTLEAGKVIVTTGGKSYPGCGTRGDGYAWARELGHTVVTPRPALVPLTTSAPWVAALKGITVPDVAVSVLEAVSDSRANQPSTSKAQKASILDSRRGSFLFTHFGMSGPVVLDISRAVTGHPEPRTLVLECDLLPGLKAEALETELQAAATGAGKKPLTSILPEQLPRRLVESLLSLVGVSPEVRLAEVGRTVRAKVVEALKRQRIPLNGALGFEKAEVTAGGVALDEVDSRDMQSKLVPNLFWAGEILDLDGPIGGYNFQAAFSTGWLAGKSV